MDAFRNLNLRYKLIFTSSATVLLLGIYFMIDFPRSQLKQSMDMIKSEMRIMDTMLGRNIASPLEFLDNASVDIVMSGLNDVEGLKFIAVYDYKKTLFSVLNKETYDQFVADYQNFYNKFAGEDSIRTLMGTYHELDEIMIHIDEVKNEDDKMTGYLLIAYDTSSVQGDVAASRVSALIITLIFLAIAGVVSYFLSSFIVKPIDRLVQFFSQMADGRGDLTKRLNIRSQDEIGQLAEQFNRFLNSQSTMIAEIKNVSHLVNEKVDLIERLSDENNRLMDELTNSMDFMLQTANQLEQGAAENVEHAKSATSQSEKTIAISMNNQKAVEKSIRQMDSIKSEVNQLEADMTTLHERSKQIQMISDLLKDLSDRTTILALNTSIEANKAGVEGTGFLIIADEIHHLADESMRSLEDINRLTIELQKSLDTSYQKTLNTTKRVDEGIENINSTGKQIEESVDTVKSNMSYVEEVYTKASKQRQRVNKIVENISTSVQNITHIKNSIDNTVNSVQEQKKHINNLSSIMSNFKISKS